ncbi:MAG: HAD family hydrolase [Chloroflexi bacterium]|nr:MAG: HAD family hydrolase [Chloroflexota bacterium]
MNTSHDNARYDVVVFDVGGTLLGFHNRAPFQAFLAQAGLPATEDDARTLYSRLMALIQQKRDSAQGLGARGQELSDWWHGIFRLAWPERPDLAAEMLRWLFDGRFDHLYDDVQPTLAGLQAEGQRLGVISNFGSHLPGVLEHFQIDTYFDFVIISAAVGVAKPDPRIFHLAVEASGRPPDRLLYVGDHVGDDVEGARAAGVDAVLVDRGDRQPGALCPRIGSLGELLRYVRVPRQPARAIILDMDGVVLDSMPHHLASWQEALAPLGIALGAEDLYPIEGVPTERTAQLLTERFLGQPCSVEEARRLATAKRAAFNRIFFPRLVPGMAPLLHDLVGRGFALGLVTGSARSVVEASLAPLGVTGLFRAVVSGDEVARGKPDAEPYLRAASRLGLEAGQCLVVENAPLGVEAARAAGMACAGLATSLPAERLAAAGADPVFATTADLREWLLARWRGE